MRFDLGFRMDSCCEVTFGEGATLLTNEFMP